MNDDFLFGFMEEDDDESIMTDDTLHTGSDFEAFMKSGIKKLRLFSFFDSMKNLIELSKGVPVAFSEVGSDESDEGVIWYDDSEPIESDNSIRKYLIVETAELSGSHHDIISHLAVDLDDDDPMYGLSINLVFDDDGKTADNWYIEVCADDDEEKRLLMIIKGGEYQFV